MISDSARSDVDRAADELKRTAGALLDRQRSELTVCCCVYVYHPVRGTRAFLTSQDADAREVLLIVEAARECEKRLGGGWQCNVLSSNVALDRHAESENERNKLCIQDLVDFYGHHLQGIDLPWFDIVQSLEEVTGRELVGDEAEVV